MNQNQQNNQSSDIPQVPAPQNSDPIFKAEAVPANMPPIKNPNPPEPMPTPKEEPEVKPEPPKTPEPNISQTPQPEMPTSVNTYRPAPLPPIKNSALNQPLVILTILTILFLGGGFAAGFFGYKYYPKLAKLISTSADSDKSDTDTEKTPQNLSAAPGDPSIWPIYSSTKYQFSVKYPDTWYSKGVDDPAAKIITFSDNNSATADTGLKVEITAQDSNGKTLKDWVTASNTASEAAASDAVEVTIDGQKALQQTLESPTKKINTYVLKNDQVITVTYYGNDAKYDQGKSIYQQILETLKFI